MPGTLAQCACGAEPGTQVCSAAGRFGACRCGVSGDTDASAGASGAAGESSAADRPALPIMDAGSAPPGLAGNDFDAGPHGRNETSAPEGGAGENDDDDDEDGGSRNPPVDRYPRCESDAQCGDGSTCQRLALPGLTPSFCAPACERDADCPRPPGPPSRVAPACSRQRCVLSCLAAPMECPQGMQCIGLAGVGGTAADPALCMWLR